MSGHKMVLVVFQSLVLKFWGDLLILESTFYLPVFIEISAVTVPCYTLALTLWSGMYIGGTCQVRVSQIAYSNSLNENLMKTHLF